MTMVQIAVASVKEPPSRKPRVGDSLILFGRWSAEILSVNRKTVDISPGTVKPIRICDLTATDEPGVWLVRRAMG
jgi:hypothetical protein